MKNYDEYMRILSSLKDDKEIIKYTNYFSLLPCLMIIDKLMKRKNTGKKPFSVTFDYQKRNAELDQAIDLIETSLEKNELNVTEINQLLSNCLETICLAKQEIKNQSLKGDFNWVEKEISNIVEQ